MKTSVLLLGMSVVFLILVCFPEDSNAIVFVLSRGRISGINNHGERSSKTKRNKQRLAKRRLRRKKKHQQRSQKYRDVRRWLKRFKQKRKWLRRMLRKIGEKKPKT